MLAEPYYHRGMQCYVNSVHYDFQTKTGTVYMGKNSCTDAVGCIAFFEGIDPQTVEIRTLAGDEQDTTYRRDWTGLWSAFGPKTV